MRTIITGSEGFIGKQLRKRLWKAGRVDLKWGDDLMKETPDLTGVTNLIHLAKIHEAKGYRECMDIFASDRELLEEAVKKGVKRFVFASSAAVYGNNKKPVTEESKINPVNYYGMNKHFMERLMRVYGKNHGIETIALRFFNVYGNSDSEGVVDRMLKNDEFNIYGNGKSVRDFVHVDDVVDSIIKSIQIDDEEAFGQEYNIGTGKGYTINQLITLINPKVVKKDSIPEIKHSIAVREKAKAYLGWEPTIKLEDYINGTRKTTTNEP